MNSDLDVKYNGNTNQIQIMDEIVIKKGLYLTNGCVQIINDEAEILFRDNQNQNTVTFNQKVREIVNQVLSQTLLKDNSNNSLNFNQTILEINLSNLNLISKPLLIIDDNKTLKIIFNNTMLWSKYQSYPIQIQIEYNGLLINKYDDHLAEILASPTSDEKLIQTNIFKIPDSNKYIISFYNFSNQDIQFSEFNNIIELKIFFKGIIYQ